MTFSDSLTHGSAKDFLKKEDFTEYQRKALLK